MTGYLKGKDLLFKGHTLECYLNMCPNYIVYKSNEIESIECKSDDILTSGPIIKPVKPEGFEKW